MINEQELDLVIPFVPEIYRAAEAKGDVEQLRLDEAVLVDGELKIKVSVRMAATHGIPPSTDQ